MREASFTIGFWDVSLTTDEVWPEGDAPEDPTAKDVADLIAKYGFHRAIGDWNLVSQVTVTDGRGGIVDVDDFDRVRVRGETRRPEKNPGQISLEENP